MTSERDVPKRSYGFASTGFQAGTVGANFAGNYAPTNWTGNGWNASGWPNNAWTGNYFYPGNAVVPVSTFGFPTNGFQSFFTPFVVNNICASDGDCAPGAGCFSNNPTASLGTCMPTPFRGSAMLSSFYP